LHIVSSSFVVYFVISLISEFQVMSSRAISIFWLISQLTANQLLHNKTCSL